MKSSLLEFLKKNDLRIVMRRAIRERTLVTGEYVIAHDVDGYDATLLTSDGIASVAEDGAAVIGSGYTVADTIADMCDVLNGLSPGIVRFGERAAVLQGGFNAGATFTELGISMPATRE